VAEVRKRGDEFWAEFEFYLSDLLVGEWQQHSAVQGWASSDFCLTAAA
jgi:hypothetical protein